MLLTNNKKNSYKKENLKLCIWILDIVFLVLIVIFFMAFLAMKNHGYADKEYSLNSDLVKKVTYETVKGNSIFLTNEEFNSIFNNLITKNLKIKENVKNINIKPKNNKEFLVIIPHDFKGKLLELCLTTNIKLNKDKNMFEVKVLRSKLGDLPIPKSIFFKYLKKSNIKYKDDVLFIDSRLPLEILNKTLEISIDEFYIENEQFVLKFKINNATINQILSGPVSSMLNKLLTNAS